VSAKGDLSPGPCRVVSRMSDHDQLDLDLPHGPLAATAFRTYLAELRTRIVGQSEPVRHLAFVALRASAYPPAPRVVILGPPGSGRSHMVRSLAEALHGHVVRVPLSEVAETNWRGRELGQWIGVATIRPGAVIQLAGLDHLIIQGGTYTAGSESTRDYHAGKQRSVASMLQGNPVSLSGEGGTTIATHALPIVVTGHLPGLPDRPSSEDYSDVGLPLLAEYLASATLIRAEPLTAPQLALVLADAAAALSRELEWLDYQLAVDPSVIARVAAAIASGRGTLREGVAWIRHGIEIGALGLLEAGAPAHTSWTLSCDDLQIPAPARGRWAD
jgi:hypothetical protein